MICRHQKSSELTGHENRGRRKWAVLPCFFILCVLSRFQLAPLPQQEQDLVVAFKKIFTEPEHVNLAVEDIIEDHRGFMWIGTTDGLFRYDGNRYVVYRHNKKDPGSIANSNIGRLLQDSRGNFWIGTNNGLDQFRWETETFTHFFHDPNDPSSISHNEVESMLEDKQGNLWFGTYHGGLNLFNRETGKFERFLHDPNNPGSISNNCVYFMTEDSHGFLWIATGMGANRFDREKGIFKHYQADKEVPGSLDHNRVQAFCEDRDGNFWVGTNNGLNRYSRKDDRFVQVPLLGGNGKNSTNLHRISVIFEDSMGRLWVGTKRAGLFLFLKEKNIFRQYAFDPENPRSLSNNYVSTIYEDSSGILWLGTIGGGINIFNPNIEKFFQFKSHSRKRFSLSDDYVSCIYEDPGEIGKVLWLGTARGLNRFDRETGKFTHYRHAPSNPSSLSHPMVYGIYKDRMENFWVATPNGLNKFDRQREVFTAFKPAARSATGDINNTVMNMHEDKTGKFWIGSSVGLLLFDRSTHTFSRYKHDPSVPASISGNSVLSIVEPKAAASYFLWVGTYNGGLNKFYPKANRFEHYRAAPKENGGLSNDSVRVIHEDGQGLLWLGTDGGLNRFDPETKEFQSFSTQDGLANDRVFGIREDGFQRLWLSTGNGLSRFDKKTGTFKTYDSSCGCPVGFFTQYSHFKSIGGEMAFGGYNGFILFYPSRLKDNLRPPRVIFTNFKLLDQTVKPGEKLRAPISQAKSIRLNYDENMFSLQFAALDFTNPRRNQYAYKLEGAANKWINLGNKSEVTLTGLEPGTYVFRVKGSNNDGAWNEAGTAINIDISPPYWYSWWFRSLVLFLICGMLYEWYRLRMKALSNRLRTEAGIDRIADKYNISKREKEIIQLILKGKSNKEIEDILFISLATVKNHIYKIYKKMGIKSRMELINILHKGQ